MLTDKREQIVRLWFDMWLRAEDMGLTDIFTADAVYIESWGPEYHGAAKIRQWFAEWNTRGRVFQWEIKQFFHSGTQTVVEWYFKNRMNDGRTEAFDGVSIIRWTEDDRICALQEFGCNEHRYDPYQNGGTPEFENEKAKWF
ncbi:MAG: nuclear transport factor 2 family protein [Oscillospiraceae bacterium]|nr:nuclear transport factor 2 family protein [Oscillospiraceae bacterium]